MGDGVDVAPDWDEVAQPAPDDEVDQRTSWEGVATAILPTLRSRAAPGTAQRGCRSESLGLLVLSDRSKQPGSVAFGSPKPVSHFTWCG